LQRGASKYVCTTLAKREKFDHSDAFVYESFVLATLQWCERYFDDPKDPEPGERNLLGGRKASQETATSKQVNRFSYPSDSTTPTPVQANTE
jgi:hypothetical protein